MAPVLFTIFGIPIQSYGFMAGLGLAFAILFCCRQAEKSGLSWETHFDICFLTLISTFVGARIFAFLTEFEPAGALATQAGGTLTGFSFFGGLIGWSVALFFFLRWWNQPIWLCLDIYFCGLLAGNGFGRIGCFLAGCCYGLPCPPPWGVQFPALPEPHFPIQLVSSATFFLGFLAGTAGLLYKRTHPGARRHGVIASALLIYLSLQRFILEFFRGETLRLVPSLTLYHFLSLLSGMVGVALLVYRFRASGEGEN